MASMWTCFSPISIICGSSFSKRSIFACEKRLSLSTPQPCILTDVITIPTTIRRSANYQPSLWSYDYVQSLDSKYTGDKYTEKIRSLKEAVRTILIGNEHEKVENPSSVLNLVDDLQRLGISYHFVNEIRDVLEKIFYNHFKSHDKWSKMDLNLKSLGFRILRQHGYHIPQDIFDELKDETGNFKGGLCEDIVCMLNLYEASFHSVGGESILDDARDFTTKRLKELSTLGKIVDTNLSSLISHALAFPLHWRVPRVESKWFIEAYERRSGMNATLLELAILDFNMVQAIHQQDLKKVSIWWKATGWEKFAFARDHLVESFMWSIAENYMPHFQGRRTLTKIFAMITTIDDVYDVYGTLHELQQFTHIVNRWDVNGIEELPYYLRICFLELYNSINEISYITLANKGIFNLPYLKKAWQDLCNAYLIEAKWYNDGYVPTLKEFLDNAYVSIGAGVVVMHAYFLTLNRVTQWDLQQIGRAENIIRHASVIVRLTNDLATSSDELKTGDVPKSIQCYMQESDTTEVEAREHIEQLILETWKMLNKERQKIGSSFPQEFIECVTNLARMGHFAYDVDKHSYPDMMRTHVLSLFVNPIQGRHIS